MWQLILVLSIGLAAPAAADPADPAGDWCRAEARNLAVCLATAEEDHAACSSRSGDRYSQCRSNRLLMRRMQEGSPVIDVERADCTLPSGVVITMSVRKCDDMGGTVAR